MSMDLLYPKICCRDWFSKLSRIICNFWNSTQLLYWDYIKFSYWYKII